MLRHLRMRSRFLCLAAFLLLVPGCRGQSTTSASITWETLPTRMVDEASATAQAMWEFSGYELATLSSLQQVADHPLYTMYFYGEYEAPDFYLTSAGPAGTGWGRPSVASQPWACSLFAALADEEHMLYGRNFDWYFSPAILLFTDPPDGYASVSMVDIAYFGFSDPEEHPLTERSLDELAPLLAAPHWPFDGVNDQGLAVGIAAVPPGNMRVDLSKPTTSSLGVGRLILDNAKDVDEAVAILEGHNIDFGGGPPVHYLIADRAGQAALVEFYLGEVVVHPNQQPWHVATNFLLAEAGNQAPGTCWRYDLIASTLRQTGGRLDLPTAIDLLEQVSQEVTEWSIVYEISSGKIGVAMGRKYDQVYTFELPLAGQ
ncbi:MAG: carcinine hydrolase/isopenicillin-N N-acyltransferase family protein [Anaerolineales bacterium]